MLKSSLSFVLFLGLLGCHTVNSVSLTQIPKQRDKKVTATASKFILLYLNFENDYIDELVTQLKTQCPSGEVKGILTKDIQIDYFLTLAQTREVTATGYCVVDKKAIAHLEPEL